MIVDAYPLPHMTETFMRRGHWWLPQLPGKEIPGEVLISPHEIKLELEGSLPGMPGVGGEFPEIDVLHGKLTDGSSATLFRVRVLEVSGQGAIEILRSRFFAEEAAIGIHLESYETTRLPEISVVYSGLRSWLSQDLLRVHGQGDQLTVNCRSISPIRDLYIPPIQAQLSVEIVMRWEWKIAEGRVTILADVIATLRPNDPQNLQWYHTRLSQFQNMLTLFTGHKAVPLQWIGGTAAIYFPHGLEEAQESSLHPIVPAEYIGTRPEILSSWYEHAERLKPVHDLFFAIAYRPNAYPRFDFLALIQALEAYHRLMFKGSYFANPNEYKEKVYEPLIEKIPGNLPDGLRDSLKSRLKYGNENSLRKRFTELMDSLPELLQRAVTTEDLPSFIGKAVDTRNYFTHYDKELREQALDDGELTPFNIRMRRLLAVLLLRSSGVEDVLIQKRLNLGRYTRWPYRNPRV